MKKDELLFIYLGKHFSASEMLSCLACFSNSGNAFGKCFIINEIISFLGTKKCIICMPSLYVDFDVEQLNNKYNLERQDF